MPRVGLSSGVTADSDLMPVFVPRTGKTCRDSIRNPGRDDSGILHALPSNPHLGPWQSFWSHAASHQAEADSDWHSASMRRAGALSYLISTPAPPYPVSTTQAMDMKKAAAAICGFILASRAATVIGGEERGAHRVRSNRCLRRSTGSVCPCFQSLNACQKRKTSARRSGRNTTTSGITPA